MIDANARNGYFAENTQNTRTAPVAATICIVGFILRIVLSDPFLNAVGYHYSGEGGGNFLEKIHPGTYFVVLSFGVLLFELRAGLFGIVQVALEQKAYTFLMLVNGLAGIYWMLRSPVGIGVILDTHIIASLFAIVMSYATPRQCRRTIDIMIFIAVINSLLGIVESIGKFHTFAFDPNWVVLHEQNFRATSIRGHPLDNAMYTAVSILVTVAMPYRAWYKTLFITIMLVSLVSFGGRAGLIISLVGLIPVGLIGLVNRFRSGNLTLGNALALISVAVMAPITVLAMLYLLISSPMGDRLRSFNSVDDASAQVRVITLQAFHYMKDEELIFGVSADRVEDIAYRMGLRLPISDLENPWLLMFMYYGVLIYPIWLVAMAIFFYRLAKGKPLGLKLAALAYLMIASTSNSFGRKDSMFGIMVCAVVCADLATKVQRQREYIIPPQAAPQFT